MWREGASLVLRGVVCVLDDCERKMIRREGKGQRKEPTDIQTEKWREAVSDR